MTRTRQLAMLTVVAVVAVLAGGWTLLVKPKSAEVSGVKAQTESQLAANRSLQSEIQRLKAQARDMPKVQARLAEIGRKLPNSPALPTLIRSLTEAADKAGVTLVAMSPAPPVLRVVTPAATTTAAAAGATAPAGTTGSTTTGSTTAAAPAAPTESLAYIPVKLSIRGGYYHLEDFLSNLESLARAYLVSDFTVEPSDNEQAKSRGELDVDITGRVYMVVPRPAPAAPAAAATAK